jgi:hypothetical protein
VATSEATLPEALCDELRCDELRSVIGGDERRDECEVTSDIRNMQRYRERGGEDVRSWVSRVRRKFLCTISGFKKTHERVEGGGVV